MRFLSVITLLPTGGLWQVMVKGVVAPPGVYIILYEFCFRSLYKLFSTANWYSEIRVDPCDAEAMDVVMTLVKGLEDRHPQ
jgi:hypothetical protein